MTPNHKITWWDMLLHDKRSKYQFNPKFKDFDLNKYRERLAIAKAKKRLKRADDIED